MRRKRLAVLSAVVTGCLAGGSAVSLAGCSSDDTPPACVTVEPSCTPLYTPTFENVYNNTLRTGCGGELSACHAAGGAGKMSLATPEQAYTSLLAGRVTPGDPGCSELIVRTHSPGEAYAMPPGPALSTAERCALARWVQDGAPGPVATREAP